MNQEPKVKSWRDRLDQHTSPLNTDQFWAGLEPQLPKPEKKRRYGILWLPLLLGLLSATGLFIYDTRQKANDLLIQNNSIDEKDQPIVQTIPDHSATKNTELIEEQISISESSTPNSGENKNKFDKKNNTKLATPEKAAVPGKINRAIPKKPISENALPPLIETSFIADAAQNNYAATRQENAEGEVAEQKKIILPSITNKTNDEDIHPLMSIAPSITSLTAKPILVEHNLFLLPFTAPSPQKKKTKRLPWMIGIQAGPGYTDFRYTDIQPETETFAATRQTTEQSLESWSAAIHGRWTSKVGLFIETGASYTRMNSRLDWTQKETTHEWGLANGFILEENGQMTPWQDSSWVTYNTVREVKHYNEITLLDLPVGVGYGWAKGSWRLDAGAGLILNLNQSAKGRSIHVDGLPAMWGSVPELTYRKSLGLSYYAQSRLTWAPKNTWGLFLQPLFQFRPTNHMDNNAGLKKTSMGMFLQCGYSYSF